MERNQKHIRLKAEQGRLHAIAFDVPGKDIMITIHLNRTLAQKDVESATKELKMAAKEWWMDSRKLDPRHFIVDVQSPDGYHKRMDAEYSMVLKLEINVLSREEIQLGNTHFAELFQEELEELFDACLEMAY